MKQDSETDRKKSIKDNRLEAILLSGESFPVIVARCLAAVARDAGVSPTAYRRTKAWDRNYYTLVSDHKLPRDRTLSQMKSDLLGENKYLSKLFDQSCAIFSATIRKSGESRRDLASNLKGFGLTQDQVFDDGETVLAELDRSRGSRLNDLVLETSLLLASTYCERARKAHPRSRLWHLAMFAVRVVDRCLPSDPTQRQQFIKLEKQVADEAEPVVEFLLHRDLNVLRRASHWNEGDEHKKTYWQTHLRKIAKMKEDAREAGHSGHHKVCLADGPIHTTFSYAHAQVQMLVANEYDQTLVDEVIQLLAIDENEFETKEWAIYDALLIAGYAVKHGRYRVFEHFLLRALAWNNQLANDNHRATLTRLTARIMQ